MRSKCLVDKLKVKNSMGLEGCAISLSIINMFVFNIVAVPISIFLHEMGHASAALCLTKRNVFVYMGSLKQKSEATLALGRIKIYLSWGLAGAVFTEEKDEVLSKNQLIGIFAGGPIVTLLLVIAMIIVYITFPLKPFVENLVFAAGIFNIIKLIVTLVPTIYTAGPYAGRPSDGYQILAALGKRSIHL